MTPTSDTPDRTAWRQPWLIASLGAALALTAVDAVLLQQRKSFFTGGFLSAIHLEGIAQTAAFIVTSLAADFAAAAPIAALMMLFTRSLKPRARWLAAFMAAAAPLLVADFIAYRLNAFLGDAFDFSLLFDLTGRKPSETLAVSSAHLVAPLLVVGATGATGYGLVRFVNRGGTPARPAPMAVRAVMAVLAVSALLTVGVTAAGIADETIDDGLQRKASGRALESIVAWLTDVDRDGYGLDEAPADPAPFDASVHPYALDVPGNGIDEDGLAGDLPAAAPYVETAATPAWIQSPNVVLIVLESFRADALGRTINGKPVTPVLDALAKTGISAPAAFSHNGYTAQSRFHIFSGSLADLRNHTTLVDDFKQHGYEVAYFSGQDDSFGGPTYSSGYERADVFYDARQDRQKRYSTFSTAGSLAVPFETVEERIATFMDRRDAKRPLFLYINFHDTHYPYQRKGLQPLVSKVKVPEGQIEPGNSAAVHEMYFNTAANVDAAIGATLEKITKQLGSRPAVIVTGDHGESLFDEGFLGHGYALNDIQTRVPLVVSGLPLVITQPFGQSDLRDALNHAMSAPGSNRPSVESAPTKRVFQYLGKIDKPRQIGFIGSEGRTIYDFRTGKVWLRDGWNDPRALNDRDAAAFRDLVQSWERMIVARQASHRDEN